MSATAQELESWAEAFYAGHESLGLGTQFMAILFDALLAGVVISQLTQWLPKWENDARHIRGLVLFASVAALGVTVFTWCNYFTNFVTDFGLYEQFASFKTFGYYPTLDGLTVIPVQMFFAERSIKINNKSIPVMLLDGGLIFATFLAALAITITTRGHDMYAPTPAIKVALLAWPAICTSAHVVLTGTILYGLVRVRKPNARNNRIVHRIAGMILESQLPATVFAVACMTCIAINPKSMFIPWIVIVHPKVFIVGCLAMVNSRHNIKQGGLHVSGGVSIEVEHSTVYSASSSTSSDLNKSLPKTPRLSACEEKDFGSGCASGLDGFELGEYDLEKGEGFEAKREVV